MRYNTRSIHEHCSKRVCPIMGEIQPGIHLGVIACEIKRGADETSIRDTTRFAFCGRLAIC